MSKWAEHQSVTRESGCFIRFIDEDKYNCALEGVTPEALVENLALERRAD